MKIVSDDELRFLRPQMNTKIPKTPETIINVYDREFWKRFWEKVNVGDGDQCWNWNASVDTNGRGRIAYNSKLVGSHRVAYTFMCGKIPEGMFVCHTCDNPLCCNPNHLFIGTHDDNMQDMVNKNRSHHNGEKSSKAKLTLEEVKDIRDMYNNGETQTKLAMKFDACQSVISRIIRNKTWIDKNYVSPKWSRNYE